MESRDEMKGFWLRSSAVFALSIAPVTIAVGWVDYQLSHLDSAVPISPAALFVETLAYALLAVLGYACVLASTGTPTSAIFNRRRWLFPLFSAVAFSGTVVGGLVENSTDVVGRLTGHRYEYVVGIVSVVGWSAVATAVVTATDRLLGHVRRRGGQIA